MISIKNLLAVTALMTGGAFISCGNSQKNSQQIEESEAAIVQAPAFNADSAYAYIAAQVQFDLVFLIRKLTGDAAITWPHNWRNSVRRCTTSMQIWWHTMVPS